MTMTVKQVADEYGVSQHCVLAWIASGDLHAVNVGRAADGRRPRWRIRKEALEAFDAARTPAPPPVRTRRRKKITAESFY